ncbi:MAG: xanthine dehydrogenase family protein subunit M [Thermoplasmataceae archaeon]
MIPKPFEYFAPRTLEDALSFLEEKGENAKIMSGGQSLIPLLKLRLASPDYIVDISRIGGLDFVKSVRGEIRIGALNQLSKLLYDPTVGKALPILVDAIKLIADPQVRNMGTIGGNICHGDPGNDLPAVMLALGATFIAMGPKGQRTISSQDFFVDTFQTDLKPGEILTEIVIPDQGANSYGTYLKLEKRAGDFAIAGAAVQVSMKGKTCQRVGIGLTSVAPKPVKAFEAENQLKGKELNEKNILAATERIDQYLDPASDLRGPADYKREMAKVLVARALRKVSTMAGV